MASHRADPREALNRAPPHCEACPCHQEALRETAASLEQERPSPDLEDGVQTKVKTTVSLS